MEMPNMVKIIDLIVYFYITNSRFMQLLKGMIHILYSIFRTMVPNLLIPAMVNLP